MRPWPHTEQDWLWWSLPGYRPIPAQSLCVCVREREKERERERERKSLSEVQRGRSLSFVVSSLTSLWPGGEVCWWGGKELRWASVSNASVDFPLYV